MRWLWGALATSAIAVCGCGSSGGSGAFTGGPEDSGALVRRERCPEASSPTAAPATERAPRARLAPASQAGANCGDVADGCGGIIRVRHVRNGPVLRRRRHPERVRRPDLRPQDVRRSERRDSVRPAGRRLRRSHRDSVRDLHRAPDLRRRRDAERVRRHRGVRSRDGDHRVHHVDRHPDELRSHGRRLRRHGHVRHGSPVSHGRDVRRRRRPQRLRRRPP